MQRERGRGSGQTCELFAKVEIKFPEKIIDMEKRLSRNYRSGGWFLIEIISLRLYSEDFIIRRCEKNLPMDY